MTKDIVPGDALSLWDALQTFCKDTWLETEIASERQGLHEARNLQLVGGLSGVWAEFSERGKAGEIEWYARTSPIEPHKKMPGSALFHYRINKNGNDDILEGPDDQKLYDPLFISSSRTKAPPNTEMGPLALQTRAIFRCVYWLKDMIRTNPLRAPKRKEDLKSEATTKFQISDNAFETAWKKAITEMRAEGVTVLWDAKGRRKAESQKNKPPTGTRRNPKRKPM